MGYHAGAWEPEKPEPIEAIKFRMDQQGLAKKDMVEYFGSASKVSEVLNGKRPLSINMIRKLNKGLGIPADILIQVPEIAKEIEEGIELDMDWQETTRVREQLILIYPA